MSGQAFYIWSAYGIAVLAIVVEILLLRAHRKAVLAQARSTVSESMLDPLAAIE